MSGRFLLIGFLCGTAVSIGNYLFLQRVLIRSENSPPKKAVNAVVKCHFAKYMINALALFLVYYFSREIWMIAGTGLGLIVMTNVFIVMEYRKSKK